MDTQQRAEVTAYARKVIIQMGVKALRMDDIAQATRTSKRTLYEVFGDKEELLFEAIKEHFDSFDQNNLKAVEGAPNVLIAVIIIMEEIRKNSEVNWHLRSSLKKFYPSLVNRLWQHNADIKRKTVADTISLGIRQGLIRKDINIALTMNVFSYIAIGISENNEIIEIPKDTDIHVAFHEVLISYLRGICTLKGVQVIDEYIKQQENNEQ